MIAKLLPPNVRRTIYGLLGLLSALEAVWDFIPDPALEGKIVATVTACGFGLAFSKVGD